MTGDEAMPARVGAEMCIGVRGQKVAPLYVVRAKILRSYTPPNGGDRGLPDSPSRGGPSRARFWPSGPPIHSQWGLISGRPEPRLAPGRYLLGESLGPARGEFWAPGGPSLEGDSDLPRSPILGGVYDRQILALTAYKGATFCPRSSMRCSGFF